VSPFRRVARWALLVQLVLMGAACDDGAPPPPTAHEPRIEPQSSILRVAGSGAMTPLASLLGAAWASHAGAPSVVVEPSVGSTGGVYAAADGAVDLGLVARPLKEQERKLGLTLVPVARDAVVLAAHPSVAVDGVTSEELVALFSGTRTTFTDGSPVTVFLRDRDDSAHAALEQLVPGLQAAREASYQTNRFRVLSHDDAMGGALAMTPGAIGVYGLGALVASRLPLKALMLDGVKPSLATLESGGWRASRALGFVVRADRLERARAFLSFVAGPEGTALARANGYLPVGAAVP
jgi:phosphate transport system substrate-binding protein